MIYFKQLFNQYTVDMDAKIETERLIFIRTNQTNLRAENYIHFSQDALRNDEGIESLGVWVFYRRASWWTAIHARINIRRVLLC